MKRFARPPAELFDAYMLRSGWARGAQGESQCWSDLVGAVRIVGSRPVQLHERLLEVDEPRRITYTVVRGAVGFRNHRGEILFEKAGDGSLLRWTVRLEPVVPGSGLLLQAATKKVLNASLNGLAR